MSVPDFSKLPPHWKFWPQQQGLNTPTVVLVHGFMGSPEDFTPIAEVLSEQYTCIAPCLKGHEPIPKTGKETDPNLLETAKTFKDYAAHINRLPLGLVAQARAIETGLQDAQVEKVYGVGYSLGGRVLLQWALTSKNGNPRLKALCLTAAHVGLPSSLKIRQQRFTQDLDIAQRLERIAHSHTATESWEAFLQFWYGLPLFGRLQEHPDYAQLKLRRCRHDPTLLAAVVRQASNALQQDHRQRLKQLAQEKPCLYVAGAEDTKYANLATELAQLQIPTALMPGVAHAIPTENSAGYTRLLAQFFAGFRQ